MSNSESESSSYADDMSESGDSSQHSRGLARGASLVIDAQLIFNSDDDNVMFFAPLAKEEIKEEQPVTEEKKKKKKKVDE